MPMDEFAKPLHPRYLGGTVSISAIDTNLATRNSVHVSGVVERIWVAGGKCHVFLKGNGTVDSDIRWSLTEKGIEVHVRVLA